ncbi:hypothetical protein E3N88_00640 [Mikania micrantha]|uniref:Uncharacterized protein n=1 Tax=Mikania micrantha TaxID=192012 RepID=A0A5N6PYP9_9ASTR|nr:hypothetical protein E3N88_00640 [Mikania micrantha]
MAPNRSPHLPIFDLRLPPFMAMVMVMTEATTGGGSDKEEVRWRPTEWRRGCKGLMASWLLDDCEDKMGENRAQNGVTDCPESRNEENFQSIELLDSSRPVDCVSPVEKVLCMHNVLTSVNRTGYIYALYD